MLRAGIPSYRLPKDVLDKEINDIEKLGVTIKTNVTIGTDKKLSELKSEFDVGTDSRRHTEKHEPGDGWRGC